MAGRKLSAEDAALWRQVASTVRAAPGKKVPVVISGVSGRQAPLSSPPAHPVRLTKPSARSRPLEPGSLDGSWDKRLGKGAITPDFTIDLHGETQSSAHSRLNYGLAIAIAQGARIILLVTGRAARENPRLPPTSRGVIRASVADWLTASPHSAHIAAIRNAHPRHGGHGALYIILRRAR